jgi:Tol biopolymer transport system component
MELSDLYSLDPTKYYYIYKEGQIFYYFIDKVYGSEVFAKVNKAIAEYRNFDGVLKGVFDMKLVELNARFFDFLRKRYMPEAPGYSAFDVIARKVIEDDSALNVNPVVIDTNRIAFISDRLIYPSIVVYDRSRQRVRRIIRGGFDEDYLEFHYGNRNNLSVSADGKLCFISRSGGDDVIHVYDIATRDDTTLDLPFRIINSPDISRDGSRIVFSALSDDRYDIFLYELASGSLRRLTDDKYFDNQPRFFGGGRIVFASDRVSGIENGDMDLFIMNLGTGAIEASIDSGGNDEFPVVSPDGTRIAFVRNDAASSLIVYDSTTGKFYEEFDAIGGIYSPCFRSDNSMILSGFQNSSFNLYDYKLRLTNEASTVSYSRNVVETPVAEYTATNYAPEVKTYGAEFSVDNILGTILFNSSFGVGLLGVMEFSDALGDHRIMLLLDSLIEIQTNVLNYVNVDLTYNFLKYRSDYGVRLFMYSNYFYEFSFLQSFYDTEQVYHHTYGVYFYYSYPFTTFDRLELTAGVRAYDFDDYTFGAGYTNVTTRYLNKETLRAAFIHDSTLDSYTGPLDGIRFEGIIEQSFSLFTNGATYTKAIVDYRQYFMLVPGYSFAVRGVAGKVFGPDRAKVPFQLGGFNPCAATTCGASRATRCSSEYRVPVPDDRLLDDRFPAAHPPADPWGRAVLGFWQRVER